MSPAEHTVDGNEPPSYREPGLPFPGELSILVAGFASSDDLQLLL